MKLHAFRWGIRFWAGKRDLWTPPTCGVRICPPSDRPLFSEREGCRKPVLRIGGWRLQIDQVSATDDGATLICNINFREAKP